MPSWPRSWKDRKQAPQRSIALKHGVHREPRRSHRAVAFESGRYDTRTSSDFVESHEVDCDHDRQSGSTPPQSSNWLPCGRQRRPSSLVQPRRAFIQSQATMKPLSPSLKCDDICGFPVAPRDLRVSTCDDFAMSVFVSFVIFVFQTHRCRTATFSSAGRTPTSRCRQVNRVMLRGNSAISASLRWNTDE